MADRREVNTEKRLAAPLVCANCTKAVGYFYMLCSEHLEAVRHYNPACIFFQVKPK